jgi:hypothetical protein
VEPASRSSHTSVMAIRMDTGGWQLCSCKTPLHSSPDPPRTGLQAPPAYRRDLYIPLIPHYGLCRLEPRAASRGRRRAVTLSIRPEGQRTISQNLLTEPARPALLGEFFLFDCLRATSAPVARSRACGHNTFLRGGTSTALNIFARSVATGGASQQWKQKAICRAACGASIIATSYFLFAASYSVNVRSLLCLIFAALGRLPRHVARIVVELSRLFFTRLLLVWVFIVGHGILL